MGYILLKYMYMFLAYLVDTKTDDVTQPHPMKLAEVNSDL